MPYLIDISRNFTTFDLGTAMLLRSKYTQKMYELCNQFSGNFRYSDQSEKESGLVYKKRVLPIQIADFRRIFNLDEVIDPRTKKVITLDKHPLNEELNKRLRSVGGLLHA